MTTHAERWQRRRAAAVAAAPRVVVRRCAIRKPWFRRGYEARIDGENLHRAWSPPRVEVGAVGAGRLRFAGDGSGLVAALPRPPADRGVVVDYGFAGDTGEVRGPLRPWPRLRDLLPDLLAALARWLGWARA